MPTVRKFGITVHVMRVRKRFEIGACINRDAKSWGHAGTRRTIDRCGIAKGRTVTGATKAALRKLAQKL